MKNYYSFSLDKVKQDFLLLCPNIALDIITRTSKAAGDNKVVIYLISSGAERPRQELLLQRLKLVKKCVAF